MTVRLRTFFAAAAIATALVPSLASARPGPGYAKAVRGAIGAQVGAKPSTIRFRSTYDVHHNDDHHLHIVAQVGAKPSTIRFRSTYDVHHNDNHHLHIQAHEPRLVRFHFSRGVSGTARTDTVGFGAGAHTTVSAIKTNPIAPNQRTAQR